MTRGGRVDGVRRSCYACQWARRSNLDDSASVLSAGQTNLLDGEIAETRTRVYPADSDAVSISRKGSRRHAIEIELHGLSRSPAGADYPKGSSRIWVNELVSRTHESLPGTHRRAFRTTGVARG